jgi:uncharacterized membrane protein
VSKIYHIRYNTKSESKADKWRLIHNQKETLVSDIYINGVKCTYAIYDSNANEIKYHVSYKGDCEILGDIAFITTEPTAHENSKSIQRHILKTISYRALGTLTTFSLSYMFTGSISVASTLGATELCVKPLLYFLHERAWYKYVKMKK